MPELFPTPKQLNAAGPGHYSTGKPFGKTKGGERGGGGGVWRAGGCEHSPIRAADDPEGVSGAPHDFV